MVRTKMIFALLLLTSTAFAGAKSTFANGYPTEADWKSWEEVSIPTDADIASMCKASYLDCKSKEGTENRCRKIEKDCLSPTAG